MLIKLKVLHSPEVHLMVVKDVVDVERSLQLQRQERLQKQEKLLKQERPLKQERLHVRHPEWVKNEQRVQRRAIN